MACSCTTSTKNIPILSSKSFPTDKDNIEQILAKNCYKNTEIKLKSKKDILIVHLKFNTVVVTSIEIFSDFETMKIYFSEVNESNYTRKREANEFDLEDRCSEYRCKRSAVEMSIVLEGGSELYYLKLKGNAPGITQAVDTKYELRGTDKLDSSNTTQSYHIGH